MKIVLIETDSAASGRGTRVTDVESGNEFGGITAITIDPITPDKPITAHLTLLATAKVTADLKSWQIVDPITGKLQDIKRIEYADGTEFVG